MVIPLRAAPPQAGGKAYQLGRLLAAGEKVPDGFCMLADGDTRQAVLAWNQQLGGLAVAVRSSAAREDGKLESFAGQFCTLLSIDNQKAFCEALETVRKSVQDGSVLVQPMIEARVAGVYFTIDPTCTEGVASRVEAIPGLGDQLVSGRVRPSAWRLDHNGITLVDGPACLSDQQIQRLQAAAQRAQSILSGELDLEFAFSDEPEPWILQARPITAQASTAQDLCLQERKRLAKRAEPQGTVWSRYSIAETLPHPTPMTWAVVDRMLSLRGAYGKLYRELGYDPDPDLGAEGIADLICGRPYINLSREARLYFKDFPLAYPLARLKQDPRKASYPTPEFDLSRARPGFWSRLPGTLWKMFRAQSRLGQLRREFSQKLRQSIAPVFLRQIEAKSRECLDSLSAEQLSLRLEELLQLVVDDFAGETLKASAFAHLVSQGRAPRGVRIEEETDLARLMSLASAGQLSLEQLLGRIGHRGNGEMELANPRWREMPEALKEELSRLNPAAPTAPQPDHPDHEWLRLRELGRHWLMFGWAEIRRTLLALDVALRLQGNIFWLKPDELGSPDPEQVARRRRDHRLFQSIPCPSVLFSDDLEAIGRTVHSAATGTEQHGTALSWGVAEGPARVVQRPEEIGTNERGYVLVCPSTDPAFTAAMSRACALVVETGGVLSHGAIVARELGLPAVANVPLGLIRDGQRLRVDGQQGTLTWICEEPNS